MVGMIGVEAFSEFLARYGSLSKEEFLAEIRVPHLYVSGLPDLDLDELFRTVQLVTGHNNSDTPRGPFRAASGLTNRSQGILPLAKAPSNNAFAMMITLGRAPNNDIAIPDKRISKFHLYFRKSQGTWVVTDANSTNGTTVDGIRLTPERTYLLRSGSALELAGSLRLLFLEPEELYDLVQYSKALANGCGWQPSLVGR